MKIMSFTVNIGPLGAIVSAMGCASCFPVLGSLGATIGLGFLAQYEGVFINKLLPVFAIISLIAVSFSWGTHRNHLRGILGIAGPIMILATLYWFWTDNWSSYMFYFAIGLMFAIGVWDFISPPNKKCAVVTQN